MASESGHATWGELKRLSPALSNLLAFGTADPIMSPTGAVTATGRRSVPRNAPTDRPPSSRA